MLPHRAILACLLLLAGSGAVLAVQPVLEFTVPPVAARGIEFTVTVEAAGLETGETLPLTLSLQPGDLVLHQDIEPGSNTIALSTTASGSARLEFRSPAGLLHTATIRVLPGILSILPPLLAIALAILFRQVVVAMLAAVWMGALFVAGFDPVAATLRTVDRYAFGALYDSGHVPILVSVQRAG